MDAATFARLAGEPTIPSLTAALELWRGPALAGLDSRVLRTRAVTLDERRLAVTETLVELRLAAGEAAAVAVELPALIAAHPLRETLRGQLMVALYRCGRQAEALAVYAEARALLADELGVDPGPELVRVHQRVLRADPALEPPPPTGPCTLPYDLPDFAGRIADLGRLRTTGDAVVITAIDGMAGIGKTALAVHAAHRLAGRYPDGQLFCDLHAHTPGALPVEPDVGAGAAAADARGAGRVHPGRAGRSGRPGGGPSWPAAACWWCWTTPRPRPRCGRCCPARRPAWRSSPAGAGSVWWRARPCSRWTC